MDKAYMSWEPEFKSNNYFRLDVQDISTGHMQYVIAENNNCEKMMENWLGGNKQWGAGNIYKFCKVWDITNFIDSNHCIDYDAYWSLRDPGKIEHEGRFAIANIQKELYRTDNQILSHYHGGWDFKTQESFEVISGKSMQEQKHRAGTPTERGQNTRKQTELGLQAVNSKVKTNHERNKGSKEASRRNGSKEAVV